MTPETVDAYASQPHFLDHILPIWRALPDELRGTFLIDRTIRPHAAARGLEATPATSMHLRGDHLRPIIVAGNGDLIRTHRRPAIFMEHGAGQTYLEKHPSYAGGTGRRHVGLFLNPNATVEGLNRAAAPAAAQATIGSPRLDRFHAEPARVARRFPSSTSTALRPKVALTFHWRCRVNPETYGALEHYQDTLEELAAGPWDIIGHGHPRLFEDAWARLEERYRAAGIRPERDFERVLEEADVLVGDNTSAIYEFASTGRPVVLMNAPWYRRHVDHGLRFWQYADVGIQVDEPAALAAGIRKALRDPDTQRRRRETICAAVYANRDGTAAAAGAAAIAEWLSFRAERAAA